MAKPFSLLLVLHFCSSYEQCQWSRSDCPLPNLRIEALHVADSGCKSKTFFRIGKINRLFFQGWRSRKSSSPDPPPPKKNPDALGGTIPLRIGQESLLRSQKYAFFLYRQIFQNLFSTGSTKNSPRRKGLPPKKEDKRERIYNMFARVRRLHQNRILTQPLTNLKYCLRQPIYSDWKAFFVSLQSLPDSNNLDQSFAKNG